MCSYVQMRAELRPVEATAFSLITRLFYFKKIFFCIRNLKKQKTTIVWYCSSSKLSNVEKRRAMPGRTSAPLRHLAEENESTYSVAIDLGMKSFPQWFSTRETLDIALCGWNIKLGVDGDSNLSY